MEGHIYDINSGDVLITNPNELHLALLPPDTIFENQQFQLREAFLDELFNQITYYHRNTLPESKSMIKALSLQLLTHVNNIVTVTPAKKESSNKIQDILIYISNNLTEKLSLELLEEKFCISKYNISRMFKQQTGYTFVEYITIKRIMLAKELMLNGMYTSEAALEAGFQDYSNF